MQENRPNNLKSFFIKLISISFAVIIIINVVFNLILGDRIEKIDKILSIFEMKERKDLKDNLYKRKFSKNIEIKIYVLIKTIYSTIKRNAV